MQRDICLKLNSESTLRVVVFCSSVNKHVFLAEQNNTGPFRVSNCEPLIMALLYCKKFTGQPRYECCTSKTNRHDKYVPMHISYIQGSIRTTLVSAVALK